MFNSSTYKSRRQKLKRDLGSGIILFLGNSESPMNYTDNTYRFRQDSSFLYFFGLDHPDLYGLIDIDNDTEMIFGDDYTIDDIVWMGVQPTIAERAIQTGIINTASLQELKPFLEKNTNDRKIHYLPPYRHANSIKLHNLLGLPVQEIKDKYSLDLVKAVVNQRNYKSEEEIAEIEKAVNVTVDMHLTAMMMAQPGMKESEIAAAVHEVAQAAGGDISFPIIATIHGETLHNHYHGNTLQS